jgi:hypothetical protein
LANAIHEFDQFLEMIIGSFLSLNSGIMLVLSCENEREINTDDAKSLASLDIVPSFKGKTASS